MDDDLVAPRLYVWSDALYGHGGRAARNVQYRAGLRWREARAEGRVSVRVGLEPGLGLG